MFGFFKSQDKKMRENAANWLELAEKVHAYRRDVIPPAELAKLVQQINALKEGIKQRWEAAKLKLQIEQAEAVLRQTGGAIYPRGTIGENVEFFVVAAIVLVLRPRRRAMAGRDSPPASSLATSSSRCVRMPTALRSRRSTRVGMYSASKSE
jgi:hypothetical protein